MSRKIAAEAVLSAAVIFASAAGVVAQTAPEIVEASKAENRLMIYSNMGTDNWGPIVAGFNAKYPWIAVETLNLGASEPIIRYQAETGTGQASADFIVTGSITDWIRFGEDGLAADYVSAEADALPDWSKPYPGVYTFSTDPMLLGYNKLVLPENLRPDSFEEFARVVTENPGLFKGKIGSYGVDGFGGSITWAFVRDHGDKGWAMLDAIGPSAKTGDGSGAMIEKTTRGEYSAVFFLSGPVIMPRMTGGLEQVMEWKYISDGTPVFMRGMAIPEKSQNINAAKMMLDYILSEEGQIAVSQAGFTPYREGLPRDQLRFDSLETLGEKIGEEDIIYIRYDRDMVDNFDAFAARWAQAMGQ